MAQTNFERYLENEVLHADPVKLVAILYRAASESVSAARRHLAAGEIRERSRQISKAWEIVAHLLTTLDLEKGGVIARQLAPLYTYMQQRLIEANSLQIDPPLAEVERLLGTISEAWQSVPPIVTATVTYDAQVADEEYAPVSCSF